MLYLVRDGSPRTARQGGPGGDQAVVGTLTVHTTTYMAERRATGSYSTKSCRAVPNRLYSLDRSFGDRPLKDLTEPAIIRWLESIAHLSPNTRAAYLSSVRQFCSWLVKRRLIKVDPCGEIPNGKRTRATPRAQPPDAIAAIIEACNDDRERAIVWLMVGMGLRRMEVAGLRWEHYDERDGLLVVAAAKGGRERTLPVPETVAAALGRIRDAGSGPVIASKRSRWSPVSTDHVGFLVVSAMKRAGVKHRAFDGVSGHALRHTAASDVLDRCEDLRAVQAMLGHADLATTAIYLRRADAKKLRGAMEGRDYSVPATGPRAVA